MTAVLDIGSNSVRMIVFDGEKAVWRGKINCRLAEGLSERSTLLPEAVARTVAAIGSLYKTARSLDPYCGVFAFATEAVRRADDGADFLKAIFDIYGLKIDLLSGEEEAFIALYGVLGEKDGAVLDIGGASSELVVRSGGETVYVKSLKTGAGVLTDSFSCDRASLDGYIREKIKEYGAIPEIEKLYLIGGTASACAFIAKRLESYDFDSLNGVILSSDVVKNIADGLFSLDIAGRMEKYNLDENRATVLACGAELLSFIIDYARPKVAITSERGNIEGYYFSRVYRSAD